MQVNYVIIQQMTGAINIVIDIWMLVGLHHMANTLEEHEKIVYFPPGQCQCIRETKRGVGSGIMC